MPRSTPPPGRRHRAVTACAALAVLGMSAVTGPSLAQSPVYTHTWRTVDGGGLTLSSSGPPQSFRVSGTVGQPDAGILTGGIYLLVGGFWGGSYRAVTAVETPEPVPAPAQFRALRPSPNPAPRFVTLAYDLPSVRSVSISVFDVSGRRVRTFSLGRVGPGRHSVVWDGTNQSNSRAAAGVYFTLIRAGEFTARGRVVLLDQ